ncbi:MucBP domain-containing protein, partial [Ligilactobacillus salivarius]|uniref:MucBP domain-containing protein n=1 Tax=Ligilactobacillus salivarius TaxID=1624 RepID=UPI0034DAC73E
MREVKSRNNLNRKLKYSIRKKKNGGGAASFIVGSVVLGGLMLGGATTVNADEVTQTGTGTDTSAKSSGSTDISGTEVALSSPSNGKPAAPSNGKPAASTAAATESTADATTSAKNKTQPTTSATSESTPEATTTPVITAGDATSESNTDTSATTNDGNNAVTAQPTTAEVVKKGTLANDKIKVSNIRFNKSVVRESEGLDLTVSFDWTGTDLKKGDFFEVPMSAGFDSMSKVVTTSFGNSANPNMGILVLDYNQRKIFAEFTQDIDPNKIYSGTINVGTFVNRDYYKNYVNETTIKIPKVDGSVEEIPLTVIFDETQKYPQLQIISMSGEKLEDKSDGSSDVTWATIVNAGKQLMTDLDIYLSADDIVNGENIPDFVDNDSYKDYNNLNIEYDETNFYKIDRSTIKVYEANVYPSTGFEKGKQLVEGTDYKIIESPSTVDNKNTVLIRMLGNYAQNSRTPLVVEWGGNIPNTHDDSTVDKVYASSFIAYHETPYNEVTKSYTDTLQTIFAVADTRTNDSSVTGVTEENNYKGSVTVMHIDGSTGNLLEKESYVKENAPIGESYTTSSKDFPGYKYVYMGTNSAPATGQVEANVQTVIYVYMPTEEKKGSVDVKYVDRATGEVLPFTEAALTTVKDNAPEGETYDTSKKDFAGYTFVGMTEESAAADGSVVADKTLHVIYAYDKIPETVEEKGSVDVKYVDTEGNILPGGDLKTVKDNAPVGEDYTTEEKSFKGYHFVGMDKTSDAANGKVTKGTKHVVYVYAKNPEEKKGSVDVKYVDRATGEVLPFTEAALTTVKDNAPEGETYDTSKKDFAGYTFVGMTEESAAADGSVVADKTLHVIYAYDKIPETVEEKGSVDVKYVTTDGKVLEDVTKVKDNAPVDEAYTTEEKSFDGYHFVGMDKTSDSANGKVTEGDKHVVYVYEKDVTPEVKKGS